MREGNPPPIPQETAQEGAGREFKDRAMESYYPTIKSAQAKRQAAKRGFEGSFRSRKTPVVLASPKTA